MLRRSYVRSMEKKFAIESFMSNSLVLDKTKDLRRKKEMIEDQEVETLIKNLKVDDYLFREVQTSKCQLE